MKMENRTTLTLSEFEQKILEGKCYFKNFDIDCDIIFSSENQSRQSIKFINCNFKRLYLQGVNFEGSIMIENCLFEILYIDNSTLHGRLQIDECNLHGIHITNSICNSISIKNSNLISNNFYVSDSKILGYVELYKLSITQPLCIFNSEFASYINMYKVSIDCQLSLQSSLCQENITMVGCVFKDGFSLDGTQAKKDILITAVDLGEKLSFTNSEIDGEVEVSFYHKKKLSKDYIEETFGKIPKKVEIRNSSFNDGFQYFGLLEKKQKSIACLKIICSKKLSGDIIFKDIEANKVLIEGANFNGRIIFNGLKVDDFVFNKFSNFLEFQLLKSRPLTENSVFEVKESILGKSSFSNIDFGKFKQVIISDSQILDLVYSNILWSKEIFTTREKDKKGKPIKQFKKERENFRQLKQLASKQGDKIASLRFEGKEWSAYRKFLKTRKGSFFDRFILWTNQSNDFGTNWIKPLVFLLVSVFFFYCVILFCWDEEVSLFNKYANGDFPRFLGKIKNKFWMYFHFLNPAHNLKHFLPELQDNNWGMFWNVLLRLFSAFFIFQTVIAFRKFTRK